MAIPFTKMHGIGNDYIYVDGHRHFVEDPAALAVAISDRHRGVGSDGLIIIEPPGDGVDADVRMRMFNADGSESEMCGNGIRCVAKYAIDHGLSAARPLRVQAGRGVLEIDYRLDELGKVVEATVDMGAPMLAPEEIPVDLSALRESSRCGVGRKGVLQVGDRMLEAIFVSMGNPHAVVFVPDVHAEDLRRLGPAVERHPAFPRRVNLHLVEVRSPTEAVMRTWERGSGETQACGTGAAAVCVACVLAGRTERSLLAHLPGGDLRLVWREGDGHVLMTGPAVEIFSGVWPQEAAAGRALRAEPCQA